MAQHAAVMGAAHGQQRDAVLSGQRDGKPESRLNGRKGVSVSGVDHGEGRSRLGDFRAGSGVDLAAAGLIRVKGNAREAVRRHAVQFRQKKSVRYAGGGIFRDARREKGGNAEFAHIGKGKFHAGSPFSAALTFSAIMALTRRLDSCVTPAM